MKPNKYVALTLTQTQTLTQTRTQTLTLTLTQTFLGQTKGNALLGKTHDVEQLQLMLKHAHNDNVVAKREAKKLLRQAPAWPKPLALPWHSPSP